MPTEYMSDFMPTTLPCPPAAVLALADSAEQRYRVYPLVSGSKRRWIEAPDPVSYTHLTLPTNREV